MCGIAGIYHYKSEHDVLKSQIQDMISVIDYRGPDGDGVYTDGALGLGHKRLTIIDTSERSNQPMVSPDSNQVICYNGEVYNYLEIAKSLTANGIDFVTSSDTEVVLQALKLKGEKALEDFNGMYAFAYWDREEKELILARDRIGIKPLFYKLTDDGIIFSSEIKSILTIENKTSEVNLDLIDSYMSLGYCPSDSTLFQGIKKLAPGHLISIKNGTLDIRQYWDLEFSREKDRGEEYYIKKTQELFEDAVKLQLRSDVPLGVFLSGGVDSSAVVAMMTKLGVKDIKTFSVAWDYGKEFNETQYARRISKQFNTDHTEYFMTVDDFKKFLPEYIRHMDEPVTEAAAISLYYLAKKAREKVTVVLSGEGADEVFGGYSIYKFMDMVHQYKKVPNLLRKGLNPIVTALSAKLGKYAELSNLDLEQSYAGVSFYDENLKKKIYTHDFLSHSEHNSSFSLLKQYYDRVQHHDDQAKMQYLDVKTWLVDDLLVKADRMSMAASLELRVPFLDHRFLQFSSRLPLRYRHKGFISKYLLKKAMEPYLDKDILYRKKQGFPTPLAVMFEGELKDYVSSILISEQATQRGYFKTEVVESLIAEHAAGSHDHHKILWQLLVLELWHREYIDSQVEKKY